MSSVALALVTALLFGACDAARAPAPPPASAPAPVSPPTASPPPILPIAQYPGHDDATGARVFKLLRDSGIEASAGGSMGYSVWVDDPERAKARSILLAAADRECLTISIFDDQGHVLPNTRPSRCPSEVPAVPPPAGPSSI
jgi:hypothetical protein